MLYNGIPPSSPLEEKKLHRGHYYVEIKGHSKPDTNKNAGST